MNCYVASNRADFMRNEGRAVLNELTDRVFPAMFNEETAAIAVDLHSTSGTLESSHTHDDPSKEGSPIDIARNLIEAIRLNSTKITNETYLPMSTLELIGISRRNFQHPLVAKFKKHTYEQMLPRVMSEGIRTVTHFPLNVIRQADRDAAIEGFQPVYKNLRDIGSIYRSEWFSQVCEKAAVTSNGYWGSYSIEDSAQLADEFKKILDLGLTFDFQPGDSRTTFSLSDVTIKALRNALNVRNHSARDNIKNQKPSEDFLSGTSSGCPVAQKMPSFPMPDPQRDERIQSVADFLDIDPAQVSAERAETAIRTALTHVGSFLGHCAVLLDARQM